MRFVALLLAVAVSACEMPQPPAVRWIDDRSREVANITAAAGNGPCRDVAVLLSTRAGSPSAFACPRKEHVMDRAHARDENRYGSEEKSASSALVVCRCGPEGLRDY